MRTARFCGSGGGRYTWIPYPLIAKPLPSKGHETRKDTAPEIPYSPTMNRLTDTYENITFPNPSRSRNRNKSTNGRCKWTIRRHAFVLSSQADVYCQLVTLDKAVSFAIYLLVWEEF